jgi:hypothetical protein
MSIHHTPRVQHAAVLDTAMRNVEMPFPAMLAAVALAAVGAVGVGVPGDILVSKAWQRERCQ